MKKLATLFIICLLYAGASAQAKNPSHQWFEEARFGLFVHFGPYSVLCDGEWVMHNKSIAVHDYKKLQHIFNPQLFDAKKLVGIAKEAGMKYITFTSRHHDGFSNWDTKQSDWNIMRTPYGKDLIRQLADECHKEGIKLALYYSLLDWSREDYSHTTGRTGKGIVHNEQKDWSSYVAFMKAQLTELLTGYGEIAGIWFDGEWDQLPEENQKVAHEMSAVNWRFDEIYSLIHTLQPACMIANNHHLPALPGEDYQAFEKDLPGENTGGGFSANQSIAGALPLETCETINRSWGYHLRDNDFKSTRQLVQLLVKSAGYGANLLLNVGPMPTGEVEDTCIARLKEMGQWMSAYGETIYGTAAGVARPQAWGATTRKGNTHYIHILNKEGEELTLQFPAAVLSAKWLNPSATSKLSWKKGKKTGSATFKLADIPSGFDAIIEVKTKK
ncbi:MAG: alpha-L-fucosidase [Prevotellaceae bacterium]|jgi:alpha-L-fucosidase|nr:alpha-L-fucosidase [Prevotellaceae bacterium]